MNTSKGFGKIITLYSYKGGTGRTMALANIAWLLASNGQRVLTMDWDFEAPGLHRYFAPFLMDPNLEESEGLIDLLFRYIAAATKDPLPGSKAESEWYKTYADVSRYTLPLDWPFPGGGRIDFIPSGKQSSAYAGRVTNFDWNRFYSVYGGSAFIEAMSAQLRQEYDYVLIDSRTGVSDTAGICTVQLPDILVVLFTLNSQSIEGASRLAADVIRQREAQQRDVVVVPVATRIEMSELEMLAELRSRAQNRFDPFLKRLAGKITNQATSLIEIQYVPYYAYDEVLAVLKDSREGGLTLLSAFERLTAVLTDKSIAKLGAISDEERNEALDLYRKPSLRQKSTSSEAKKDPLLTALEQHKIWVGSNGSRGEKAVLRSADLTGLQLEKAELSRIILEGAVLDRAVLREANAQDANFTGASLGSADLQEADLRGAILTAARMESAQVQDANLDRANLTRAMLRTANLTKTSLRKAILIDASLEGAQLQEAILDDADLSGAKLAGANLSGASLFRVDLTNCQLERADLSYCKLREANFEKANVQGADLRGADLTAARGLTQAQVDAVVKNSLTRLPSLRDKNLERKGWGNVFIVRPFGTKSDIDFDRVEAELIRPAMDQAGLMGGITGQFIQQGNIRTDMFEQLLIADLVIADMSIHNANVFYELGIRHALRDKRTFLIKSKSAPAVSGSALDNEVPFDLKTDRYLSYDPKNPSGAVDILAAALKLTLDSQNADSPVYQLLPALEPADPNKVLVVPIDFREDVARVEAAKNCGDLQLLAAEVDGFAWRVAGLRMIGHAQFRMKDWTGAKATWVAVREYDDMDVEANTLLGTILQRLDDLVGSDQAVERALQNKEISPAQRAEIRALMGRNAKTQWEQSWAGAADLDATQQSALSSPYLEKSFELYRAGFTEDRNHFYSGLNALAMVTIMTELAQAKTEIWEDGFDSKEEATQKLQKLKELRGDLAAGVRLAIESRQVALQRTGESDVWVDISTADLIYLTSTRPNRVAQVYKKALTDAPELALEAVRRQLVLYQRLGVLRENAQAAIESIDVVPRSSSGLTTIDVMRISEETKKLREIARVVLFTGHRIDAADRPTPRFPAAKEGQARAMIREAVANIQAKTSGALLGISGGASGGDILFHEVCEELGIPSQMYLVLPKSDYVKASVADGGPGWVERFNRLFDKFQPKILSDSDQLPRWLRAKKGYSIWQRSNLWMLHNALFLSQDHLTLIALWNGATGDGPGGTEDMVKRAQDRGARFILLDARKLVS